jgi:hypothetical protein
MRLILDWLRGKLEIKNPAQGSGRVEKESKREG